MTLEIMYEYKSQEQIVVAEGRRNVHSSPPDNRWKVKGQCKSGDHLLYKSISSFNVHATNKICLDGDRRSSIFRRRGHKQMEHRTFVVRRYGGVNYGFLVQPQIW